MPLVKHNNRWVYTPKQGVTKHSIKVGDKTYTFNSAQEVQEWLDTNTKSNRVTNEEFLSSNYKPKHNNVIDALSGSADNKAYKRELNKLGHNPLTWTDRIDPSYWDSDVHKAVVEGNNIAAIPVIMAIGNAAYTIPEIAGTMNLYAFSEGTKRLTSDEGVKKTWDKFSKGDYTEGIKSLGGDALDILMSLPVTNKLSQVGQLVVLPNTVNYAINTFSPKYTSTYNPKTRMFNLNFRHSPTLSITTPINKTNLLKSKSLELPFSENTKILYGSIIPLQSSGQIFLMGPGKWKLLQNPGFQLKSLLPESQLEKYLSKTGLLSINLLQAYLKNASKLEQSIINNVVNTQFAGLKSIDYNTLRKAVQDELITYSKKPQSKYSVYGMNRLGFITKQEHDGTGGIIEYAPGVKTQTFTFESPRIPIGNAKHYDDATLGHSRTYTTSDEPDILHVMESQSDWGLGKIRDSYSRYSPYFNDPKAYKDFIDRLKKLLEKMQSNPELYRKGAIEEYIDNIKHHENILNLLMYDLNDVQIKHLHDNYLSRLLLENMIFAALQGLKKMRYPTSDTAAKIEGFKKTENKSRLLNLRRLLQNAQNDFENGIIGFQEYDNLINDVKKQLQEVLISRLYSPEHQTILKKYTDFPKMFNKSFKGLEVRTVTDPKNNTWYEVDIPESYLNGTAEIQFKKGGSLNIQNDLVKYKNK